MVLCASDGDEVWGILALALATILAQWKKIATYLQGQGFHIVLKESSLWCCSWYVVGVGAGLQ